MEALVIKHCCFTVSEGWAKNPFICFIRIFQALISNNYNKSSRRLPKLHNLLFFRFAVYLQIRHIAFCDVLTLCNRFKSISPEHLNFLD